MIKKRARLKIHRLPEYLSPSGLGTLENQPNTYYTQKLKPKEKCSPRTPQGMGAAYGSSFDTLVKLKLLEDGIGDKSMLPEIKKGVELKDKSIKPMGERILKAYVDQGVYRYHDWVNIEEWMTWTFRGVPMHTRLDATVRHEGLIIPHDWKCFGFVSEKGQSPHPAFKIQFTNKGTIHPHKRYTKRVPIESVDKAWGKQFTSYGWALGFSKDKWQEFPVSCDMMTQNKTGGIKITHYIAWATVKYQRELYRRYLKAWGSLQNGSFINRLASQTDINIVYTRSKREKWF